MAQQRGQGPAHPSGSRAEGDSWSPAWAQLFALNKKIFFIIMSSSPRFSVTHTHLFIPSIQHTLINHLFCAKHFAP